MKINLTLVVLVATLLVAVIAWLGHPWTTSSCTRWAAERHSNLAISVAMKHCTDKFGSITK